MNRADLPSKLQAETRAYLFDFSSQLVSGETISTQVCTAAVYSGTDASPASLISGSATAAGAVVSQKLAGGVEGVIYTVTCTVTTSAGQVLALAGWVAVVPA